ncbi:Hpt domain-containing protein [Methylobacterium sp. A54F]
MGQALDASHLAEQTGGDQVLASELLGLFAAQCRRLAPLIEAEAAPASERADFAHTLKGSALGVGAFPVARAAEAIEDALRSGCAVAAEDLIGLADAVSAVLAAIERRP